MYLSRSKLNIIRKGERSLIERIYRYCAAEWILYITLKVISIVTKILFGMLVVFKAVFMNNRFGNT